MSTWALIGVLSTAVSAQESDGVVNVWVSASQWPDARTHETFAKDAVRLYGAENGTDEQKALAIYYHALRVWGHGGDYFQGPPGREEAVWDSWMISHCYVKGLCEWWGWLLIDLWKAYKGNPSFDPKTAVARKVGLNAAGENPAVPGAGSHVQAALRWTDADGVDRWHLFDGNMGFFARVPGTDRIASPEEIRAGYPDILIKPHNPPHPYMVMSAKHGDAESAAGFRQYMGYTYPFAYSGSQRRTKYRTDFDLRKGESLRRQWHDDGKAVACKRHKDIAVLANIDGAAKYMYSDKTPKDPYNFPVQRPYFKTYPGLGLNKPFGNAYSVYAPAPASGPETVYPIRHIYPFAESFVRGTAVLPSEGSLAVDFSLDEGKTWIEAWTTSDVRPQPFDFEVDLGKGRWDKDLPSTYNMPDRDSQYLDYTDRRKWDAVRFTGFQYQVRVRRTGGAAVSALRIENTHQLNIGMLPTLLPGANRITVEGASLAPGRSLKVEYVWEENGKEKRHVEVARSLPHVYEIRVEEKDPLKVRCLHQTLAVE